MEETRHCRLALRCVRSPPAAISRCSDVAPDGKPVSVRLTRFSPSWRGLSRHSKGVSVMSGGPLLTQIAYVCQSIVAPFVRHFNHEACFAVRRWWRRECRRGRRVPFFQLRFLHVGPDRVFVAISRRHVFVWRASSDSRSLVRRREEEHRVCPCARRTATAVWDI